MPFTFIKARIDDVVVIQPRILHDGRGFFAEVFKASEFEANGIKETFVQVNHSKSQKNVLRGLHYQLAPKAQAKLISVLKGEILDVAVDIRKGSPSFGQWVSEKLSEDNKRMLYVPVGFAHGFCALTEDVEIMYYCSQEYDPALDRSILWNDPQINISWPVTEPIISPKDAGGKLLKEAENNFIYGENGG